MYEAFHFMLEEEKTMNDKIATFDFDFNGISDWDYFFLNHQRDHNLSNKNSCKLKGDTLFSKFFNKPVILKEFIRKTNFVYSNSDTIFRKDLIK